MAGNNVFSMTEHGRSEPFDVQVARGLIKYHSTVNIYGYQAAVATTNIPVWEVASGYTYPVAATTMNLVSNDATDTTMTVLIQGLDASYSLISETLALNGTIDVVTTKSYLRINSMSVATGTPAGAITLKDLTNTTTYARINASIGRTQMAIYTVPAGYTFYLSRIDAYTSLNGFTANYATYRNYAINNVTSARSVSQQAPFTNTYHAQRVMPRPFTEKTDIQLQCKVDTGTGAVSIAAEGYLILNTAPAAS
jgi:hypothetical protein